MTMRVLCLYNATETYTEAVFEHLDAFRRHSNLYWVYLHWESLVEWKNRVTDFDILVIHYSVRLPFDQITDEMAEIVHDFAGTKAVFLQDEYDGTNRTKYWLQRMGINVVFTVVPERTVNKIYPTHEFPDTAFHTVLTGYVPDGMAERFGNLTPTFERTLIVGYRGRILPIHYGALGQEKWAIAKHVKRYCESYGIAHDIECSDESRIYGVDWYRFIASCRAMLGTESGSNVFNWSGTLVREVASYRQCNTGASDDEIYDAIIRPLELPNAMNQISPRIFEMAAARTVMILFEGSYSDAIDPSVHYIALRKDFSNLLEVFAMLNDRSLVSRITENAFSHVIESGKYSYSSFTRSVDNALLLAQTSILGSRDVSRHVLNQMVQDKDLYQSLRRPLRASPPYYPKSAHMRLIKKLWKFVPKFIQLALRAPSKFVFDQLVKRGY